MVTNANNLAAIECKLLVCSSLDDFIHFYRTACATLTVLQPSSMVADPALPVGKWHSVCISVLSFRTACLSKHMVLSHLMQWTQQTTEALDHAGVTAYVGTSLLLFPFESHCFLPFSPYYLHNNFMGLQATCTHDSTFYACQAGIYTSLHLSPIHSATFFSKILNPEQTYLWSASYSLLILRATLPACLSHVISVCFSSAANVMSSLSWLWGLICL